MLALRTAGALAAAPLLVLAGLVLAEALAPGPALLAAAVVAGAALVLARIWVQDVARIIGMLYGQGDSVPVLAATAHIAQAAERVLRAADGRNAALLLRLEAESALLDRMPDPIVMLDGRGAVRRTNAAALREFGAEIPALLRHPGLRGALDRARATGLPAQADLALSGPMQRDVALTLIPLPAEGPGAAHPGEQFAAILADHTRERAVERMRADFVANASHELRTPLASLIGFIATLRGPAADDAEARARFLPIMAEQAERMSRLIDDLLSLSRVEVAEHKAPEQEVDLAALLRRSAAAMEPQIAARRVTLVLEVANGLAARGDEDQLDQVLHNLLENALKYGRDGGTVRLHAAPAEGAAWPARPGVVVTVADDGPGVPREHIPRLTERFYRADKHRSRAVGGTGLGLAIVKHIVNRHRGRLAIESAENRGTTIRVWLPKPGPAAAAGSGAEDRP